MVVVCGGRGNCRIVSRRYESRRLLLTCHCWDRLESVSSLLLFSSTNPLLFLTLMYYFSCFIYYLSVFSFYLVPVKCFLVYMNLFNLWVIFTTTHPSLCYLMYDCTSFFKYLSGFYIYLILVLWFLVYLNWFRLLSHVLLLNQSFFLNLMHCCSGFYSLFRCFCLYSTSNSVIFGLFQLISLFFSILQVIKRLSFFSCLSDCLHN